MQPRRLTDQGKERKQQLLDVAAALFSSRGYAATRVADICDEAGVAKGLFYWYFENKEALFADLVRNMRQRVRRAQGGAIDRDADPLTRLRQGTEASVRFMAEQQSFFALLEVESRDRSFSALFREGTDEHVADTAAILADARRAGQVPEDADVRLLALGVVGAVAHFSHFHRTGRIDLPVDDLARFVGQWVVQAVGGLDGDVDGALHGAALTPAT